MSDHSAPHVTSLRAGPLLGPIVLFSVCVNVLMLTGPLFMLQVYDRVLASRSEASLVALFALVAFLFALMGVFDHVRGRIAARAGARFQAAADRKILSLGVRGAGPPAADDVLAVRSALTSPLCLALFDVPWTPMFLAAIFLFHPALGWLAIVGLLALVALALAGPAAGAAPAAAARLEAARAERLAAHAFAAPGLLASLGVEAGVTERWRRHRAAALLGDLAAADRAGAFLAAGRAFRFFMQSAMLALGALLVIRGALSPGAMIAASILLGRALAPIDQAVSGWPLLERGLAGWRATRARLAEAGQRKIATALPRPDPALAVEGLYVVPPGAARAALIGLTFGVDPGEVLGVIGASGSGKSTLARALSGAWVPEAGRIRLGGATLDQYPPDDLARYIGYLPQDVDLFPGTVAENIARMALERDDEAVVRAAGAAGAHDLILRLPRGYDTVVGAGGSGVSGGQRQRIALARALFGGPELLILDEPNSNLDAAGEAALTAAVRAWKGAGKAVVIMAHRPAAIAACDRLMVLEAGRLKSIGPRDEILRANIANHAHVRALPGRTGTP